MGLEVAPNAKLISWGYRFRFRRGFNAEVAVSLAEGEVKESSPQRRTRQQASASGRVFANDSGGREPVFPVAQWPLFPLFLGRVPLKIN